jgi:hypothetical protein
VVLRQGAALLRSDLRELQGGFSLGGTMNSFEDLNQADRECAIDCAVAAVILASRIPSVGKPLYDWLTTEFATTYNLPKNAVRYILRDIGQSLYGTDWAFSVTKKEEKLITLFVPVEASSGDGAGAN